MTREMYTVGQPASTESPLEVLAKILSKMSQYGCVLFFRQAYLLRS